MSLESQSIRVECIVPGGDGLARLVDGRPIFVTGGLPGDELQLTEVSEKKSYARATQWELKSPSEDRREPPCDLAGECGGCDLMALTPAAQTKAKLQILKQALARTGGIHDVPRGLGLISAGPDLAYRSRVRLHLAEGELGYYARGTRRLVVAPACAVCVPELSEAVSKLRAHVANAPAAFRCFGEAEVRVFEPEFLTDPVLPALCLYVTDGIRGLPPEARAQVDALQSEFHVSVVQLRHGSERGIRQSEHITEVNLTTGTQVAFGVGAFSQVNWRVNQKLVSDLVSAAKQRGLTSFLDLYSGAGNFSLPLLNAGLSGVSVEGSAVSVKSARKMAKKQGHTTARFIKSDVEPALKQLLSEAPRFDLALLDPPRAGAKRVLERLCRMKPKAIFMCSCDPVTFARDLKALIAAGYQLESVQGYDMFPQTHHIEATAWLVRS